MKDVKKYSAKKGKGNINSYIDLLKKIKDLIRNITLWISLVSLVGMVFIVWISVFFRYVLGNPIPWSEEITRYLLVYMAFMGIVAVFSNAEHIRLSFIRERFLSPKHIRWLEIFYHCLILWFSYMLVIEGIKNAQWGWREISPALGLPMFYPFFSVPLMGVFLFILSIIRIILLFLVPEKEIVEEFSMRDEELS